MKITDVKPFVVDCFRTNFVFVKIYTDEGIAGVGEGTLEYKKKDWDSFAAGRPRCLDIYHAQHYNKTHKKPPFAAFLRVIS